MTCYTRVVLVEFGTKGERNERVADEPQTCDGRYCRFAATVGEIAQLLVGREQDDQIDDTWPSWVTTIGPWAFGEDGDILDEYM